MRHLWTRFLTTICHLTNWNQANYWQERCFSLGPVRIRKNSNFLNWSSLEHRWESGATISTYYSSNQRACYLDQQSSWGTLQINEDQNCSSYRMTSRCSFSMRLMRCCLLDSLNKSMKLSEASIQLLKYVSSQLLCQNKYLRLPRLPYLSLLEFWLEMRMLLLKVSASTTWVVRTKMPKSLPCYTSSRTPLSVNALSILTLRTDVQK